MQQFCRNLNNEDDDDEEEVPVFVSVDETFRHLCYYSASICLVYVCPQITRKQTNMMHSRSKLWFKAVETAH